MEGQVRIIDSLSGIGSGEFDGWLAHALCVEGYAQVRFNSRDFQLKKGGLMIVRKGQLFENFIASDDFRVKVMYATPEFISLSTPRSNYGTKGQLALFLNPIMNLTEEQYVRCLEDFDILERRIAATDHNFYHEVLMAVVQTLILDFFDFHSQEYGMDRTSSQNASIMNAFIEMLESGVYREHREVTYYADKLCVTPKYLSEVSKKVSGCAANYWINRYTVLDISRLLRDKTLTFSAISDMFGFSSPAYFSRYVQHHLGVNPTEYRK